MTPYTRLLPILVLITCAITYYIATQHHEVPPFPHCTITMTATPYPQDILFRYILGPSALIFGLLWISIYFVLKGQNVRLGSSVPVSSWIFYFGIIGSFCYEMAIATIDSGQMADTLHSVCAVIFFILWTINMCLVSEAYGELRKIDPNVISWGSLMLKYIISIAMVLLWVLNLLSLAIPTLPEIITQITTLGVQEQVCIVEWGSMLFLCLWVYTFTWDFKDYEYFLNNGQANQVMQNLSDFYPQNTLLQAPLNGFGQIIQVPKVMYHNSTQNFYKVANPNPVYQKIEMTNFSQN